MYAITGPPGEEHFTLLGPRGQRRFFWWKGCLKERQVGQKNGC